MKWKRKTRCPDCGKSYVIDTEKRVGRCGCGRFRNIQVPSKVVLDLFFEAKLK
jgi:ribosomal protein S27AE